MIFNFVDTYLLLMLKGNYEIVGKPETRYYISSLSETAQQFAYKIRAYWGVENKAHYVQDVTQAEMLQEFESYRCRNCGQLLVI